MAILSPLLGDDFNIKTNYTYATRLLINDDICNSRIKITFLEGLIYPFEFFIRNADENGKAIIGSPIFRELVNYPNTSFIIIVPKNEKILLIFGFNNKYLPSDINEFKLNYEIEHLGLGNQIVTDMYMFETASGIPYRPHAMGSYSEFEFTEKIPLKGYSEYSGKTGVSRIIVGHEHENERGYVDRVYILPKRGKTHGSHSVKNKGIDNKEEIYIYLDPLQNTKQITSASNNVIRGLMFKTSDAPSSYGRIVFKFITLDDKNEVVNLIDEDSRNGVTIASCKAPEYIIYNSILYGLSSEFISNPMVLKLEENEEYKEGIFKYFPVLGNFIFYFKRRVGYNPEDIESIDPIEYIKINALSSTYNAPEIIEDEYGMWKLINKQNNPMTLYPNFSYNKQNFYMQPNEYIKYTFFYEFNTWEKIYNFTGNYEIVTLKPGVYVFECWGAAGQGGYPLAKASGSRRGLGGYTRGTIKLVESKTFYLYVGGHGLLGNNDNGGWNGGGNADNHTNGAAGGGGGGASDIRLVSGNYNDLLSLYSRIMVAAGGGGADDWDGIGLDNEHGTGASGLDGESNDGSGGNGGGLHGGPATNNGVLTNSFPTQTKGYSLGIGESIQIPSDSGAGGGGYYGGYAGTTSTNAGGSGGSSFISGMNGCNSIDINGNHTGDSIHFSGLFFENSITQSGIRDGNGLIKISMIDFLR